MNIIRKESIDIIPYVILLLNLFCRFFLVSSRQTSRKFAVIYESLMILIAPPASMQYI